MNSAGYKRPKMTPRLAVNFLRWVTLKAGMMEQRNDGITERRKMTQNPKRWNRGTAERRKITPNPKRWNRGTAERWKITRNPKRRNDGKSPQILKDGKLLNIVENHPISQKRVL